MYPLIKVKIASYSLSYIHETIRQTNSLRRAALTLGIDNKTLDSYLKRLIYQGKALNYPLFKQLTPAEAKSYWGEAYDQPMSVSWADMAQYTVAEIHNAVYSSSTVKEAAQALRVRSYALESHLGKYTFANGQRLNFSYFKKLSPQKVQEIWSESYNLPMKLAAVEINELPIAYIHEQIQKLGNATLAAAFLGLPSRQPLMQFLYKLGLNFLDFQKLSPATVLHRWPVPSPQFAKKNKKTIANCTPAEIYAAISRAQSNTGAAHSLGIQHTTLSIFLGRYSYQHKRLNFSLLRALSLEEAKTIWQEKGEDFYGPIETQKVNLADYTLAQLHKKIRRTKSISATANFLGVTSVTLERHLGKFSYKNCPLTFEILQQLSIHEAETAWKSNYYKRMPPPTIQIGAYPLSRIHQLAHTHPLASKAANDLGVTVVTLHHYLRGFTYHNKPLTYEIFRKLSVVEAEGAWGEMYYQPPFSPTKINYLQRDGANFPVGQERMGSLGERATRLPAVNNFYRKYPLSHLKKITPEKAQTLNALPLEIIGSGTKLNHANPGQYKANSYFLRSRCHDFFTCSKKINVQNLPMQDNAFLFMLKTASEPLDVETICELHNKTQFYLSNQEDKVEPMFGRMPAHIRGELFYELTDLEEVLSYRFANILAWEGNQIHLLSHFSANKKSLLKFLSFLNSGVKAQGVIGIISTPKEILEHIIMEYKQKIVLAQTEKDKLLAIAQFAKKMNLLHPFAKGISRTIALLINKLLYQNHLAFTQLSNPDAVDIKGATWLVENQIKPGQKNWRELTGECVLDIKP